LHSLMFASQSPSRARSYRWPILNRR